MKNTIRHNFLKLRDQLSSQKAAEYGHIIAQNFLNSKFSKIPEGRSLMLYSSFRNEADTHEIIAGLYKKNLHLVLPFTSGGLVTAYDYIGPDAMIEDVYGILSPDRDKAPVADLSLIHTVLVPGVVYDHGGGRIGFGKGCYDRFLPNIPQALKIGVCYDFQLSDEDLPKEPTDISMDYILTEKGIINCKTRNYIDL